MPFYRVTIALLAVAGMVVAIPNGNAKTSSTKTSSTSTSSATPTSQYYSLPQIARFDNDPNLGLPVIAAAPVNEYLDILFNGFTGVPINDQAGVGIPPQSPPNSIAFGPLLAATIDQGPAAMTAVYPDTTVDFFDLLSLYYGCDVDDESSVATLPASCSITATCVNPQGQKVAEQSFDFVDNEALEEQMVEVIFDGFKGCQSVGFNATSALTVGLSTCFDTISYTVYSRKPLSP